MGEDAKEEEPDRSRVDGCLETLAADYEASRRGSSAAKLASYDAKLRALRLPPNASMVEGSPFTPLEREVLARCRKECGDAVVDSLSGTWQDRLVRGMYTNNRGSHEDRVAECAEFFTVIAAWREATGADGLAYRPVEGAALVNAKARGTAGGLPHCVALHTGSARSHLPVARHLSVVKVLPPSAWKP